MDLQRTAKELEQLQALLQVRQAAASSAELMAPVARRKVRKEIEKVMLPAVPDRPRHQAHCHKQSRNIRANAHISLKAEVCGVRILCALGCGREMAQCLACRMGW